MRNFKKFLALVLAMLMVSACAVSVSAVQFGDQDAIVAAGVNEAVSTLVDLGVIKGRDDGNFYPNDTLTREEACVILAKLRAGSEGQKYEWAEETTSFVDVTAKWSFAYINYANRNGFMTGIGDNQFNPKGVLTIEQALCAAVKAYKGDGTKDDPSGIARYVERVEALGEHAYWAGHYTDIAEELGLTEGVPFNYTGACTRGTMAKIAYNLFVEDASIEKGFGLAEVDGTLTVVANDTVTIGGVSIVRSVLEAALAENGFEGALTDYIGAKFLVKYDAKNNTVYSASLKSGMMVFESGDGLLSINKDSDDKNTNTIKLFGKTYRANKLGSNGGSGLIGGAGAYPEITVSYTGALLASDETESSDGKVLNNLPTYYKAFAYDDNSDGNYDRLIVKEYKLASIKANTEDAKDGVAFDTVKFMNLASFTNYGRNDNKAPIVYTGDTAIIDDETPNLVNVSYNEGTKSYVVDVLEVASTETGIVTGIVSGKQIKIGASVLDFNNEYVAPESETLKQNTTVFTIYGKYVKVASVSSTTKTIMVDNVTIDANGNAVVSGLNKSGFGVEKITVLGIVSANKLVDRGAFVTTDKDGVKSEVFLATASNKTADVTFKDGYFYSFVITDKGAYVDVKVAAIDIDTYLEDAAEYEEFSVKNGYVYYDGVAKHKTDSAVVIKVTNKDEAKEKNVYCDTYVVSTTLSEVEGASAVLLNGDFKAIGASDKVKVVLIDNASITGTNIISSLASGQTIVQIIAEAHELGFDYDTYEAVDLMNGTKVNVQGNGLTVGNYYVVKDGKKVSSADNQWVLDTAENNLSDVTVAYGDSIVGTITAKKTRLEKSFNEDDYTAETFESAKEFGIDQITIYAGDGENNVIKIKDGAPVTLKVDDVLLISKDIIGSDEFDIKAGASYAVTKTEKNSADEDVVYTTTTTYTAVDTYVVGSRMILVLDIDTVTTTDVAELEAPITPAE